MINGSLMPPLKPARRMRRVSWGGTGWVERMRIAIARRVRAGTTRKVRGQSRLSSGPMAVPWRLTHGGGSGCLGSEGLRGGLGVWGSGGLGVWGSALALPGSPRGASTNGPYALRAEGEGRIRTLCRYSRAGSRLAHAARPPNHTFKVGGREEPVRERKKGRFGCMW